MKLSELQKGESGQVTDILCDEKTAVRLKRIGLTEGVKVTAIRRAPLGDPIEIKIRDFFLAIRLSDAEKIELAPPTAKISGDKP